MSGDSTKECDRVLFSGSSGWSIRNEPADFDSVPCTFMLPYTRNAFVVGQFGDWQRTPTGPIWFQRMDRNNDGDLTWNEFLGPREVYHELDADHDDLLDPNEAGKAGL